ncbi:unnamed protein product, partial [marine sediment metagenome]
MPKIDFKKLVGAGKKKPAAKPAASAQPAKPIQPVRPASIAKPAQAVKAARPTAQAAARPVPAVQAKPAQATARQIAPKPVARPAQARAKPAQAGARPVAPNPAARPAAQPGPEVRPRFVAQKQPVAKKIVSAIKGKFSGIERVPTGIVGLDPLIEGGFERGSSILLVGSSGTGKTLFAQQFLYYGAKEYNEPSIFISFEEERDTLYRHSASFGWDFEALEKKGLFKVLEYKPHQVEKLMAEGGGTIKDQIRAMGAKRLVVDSITSYALLFKDEYQKRENILDFFDMLGKWGCTSIIISELSPKLAEIKEGSVGFLTDAIIS